MSLPHVVQHLYTSLLPCTTICWAAVCGVLCWPSGWRVSCDFPSYSWLRDRYSACSFRPWYSLGFHPEATCVISWGVLMPHWAEILRASLSVRVSGFRPIDIIFGDAGDQQCCYSALRTILNCRLLEIGWILSNSTLDISTSLSISISHGQWIRLFRIRSREGWRMNLNVTMKYLDHNCA